MPLVVQEILGTRTFKVGSFVISVSPENCLVRVTSWDWKEMNGENAWWHHGCTSIWHFIAGCGNDPHYVMEKLFDSRGRIEVDEHATRLALFTEAQDLDAEEKEDVEEHLKGCTTADEFAGTPHISEPYEHIVYKEKHCCTEFRKAWPAFCGYVKEGVIPYLPKE